MGTRGRAEGGQERSRRTALGFTGSECLRARAGASDGFGVPPRSPRVGAPTSGPPLRQPSELSGAGREDGRPVVGKGEGPVRSARGPDQREVFVAARPGDRASRARRGKLDLWGEMRNPLGCPEATASLGRETGNDPSAGSPTETLLRLLLPLDSQV